MSNSTDFTPSEPLNFADFPEDVQLSILSFLPPADVSAFSCTSKSSASLCRADVKLWHALCDRRWSSVTSIKKWGNGKIQYKLLYKKLNEWEKLIGFWRRSGQGQSGEIESPALVLFEWGKACLTGSRVSPCRDGSYNVVKAPFLWLSLCESGEVVIFLDPDGTRDDLIEKMEFSKLGFLDGDLIPVNVSFMGRNHLVVEENLYFNSSISKANLDQKRKKNGFSRSSSSGTLKAEEEIVMGSPGSLPDRLMMDVYQHIANRTSPVSDREKRRQRKKERGRRKWEAEHFIKIVNCSPTPDKPLQGLWKGISDDDPNLDFYLVAYDDIGGVACRRVGDTCKPFSSYSPVFWTSNTEFIESPLSPEEEYIYASRIHLRPSATENYHLWNSHLTTCNEPVSRIMYINSSYDLVIPSLTATINPRLVEGRIWQYQNGTFGFGFLRDSFVVDLKLIAQDGHLLDVTRPSSQ